MVSLLGHSGCLVFSLLSVAVCINGSGCNQAPQLISASYADSRKRLWLFLACIQMDRGTWSYMDRDHTVGTWRSWGLKNLVPTSQRVEVDKVSTSGGN